ncbi:RNA recognition motif (RRM, RBD, or RNP domain) [Novymonas esmeraldas]|uniref:RNA recognition motif (RRM, RBD, or RNP domain) n=1 Tax=Novymonas esmeraldas TaxID=1808958 RepID=A0AAW0EU71_9TRYP
MATSIRVRNLPATYSSEQLLRLCACFGEVAAFTPVGEDGEAGGGAATADVAFEEKEDALAAAANMEGMEFAGVFLRVRVHHE